jgi:hypothetical protein
MTVAALGPKLPPYSGDSWRLAASVLGAVPLAVASAALAGVSVAAGASGMPPRHAPVAVPVQHGVTVAAGALASPKYPYAEGD